MDLEGDMKAIALLSQMLPTVVMVKPNITRPGTIQIAPTKGRAISKDTNEELPKDLEVCLEETLKQ